MSLYVASGVPLSHLKFVAVANAEATSIALDDAHYRVQFATGDPNLPLIAALKIRPEPGKPRAAGGQGGGERRARRRAAASR